MAAGRKTLLTKKSVAAQFRFAELHLNKPPDVCNNVLWILSHVYAFTASNLSFGQYFSIHCTISLYCCLPTVLIFLWSSSAAYPSVHLYTLHSTDHQKYAIHSHLQKKGFNLFSLSTSTYLFGSAFIYKVVAFSSYLQL